MSPSALLACMRCFAAKTRGQRSSVPQARKRSVLRNTYPVAIEWFVVNNFAEPCNLTLAAGWLWWPDPGELRSLYKRSWHASLLHMTLSRELWTIRALSSLHLAWKSGADYRGRKGPPRRTATLRVRIVCNTARRCPSSAASWLGAGCCSGACLGDGPELNMIWERLGETHHLSYTYGRALRLQIIICLRFGTRLQIRTRLRSTQPSQVQHSPQIQHTIQTKRADKHNAPEGAQKLISWFTRLEICKARDKRR